MQKRYPEATIGHSDHTPDLYTCFAATALGAKIIEKHFTIDKNYSNFRDHKLSADTQEMTELVSKIDQIEKFKTTGLYLVNQASYSSGLNVRYGIRYDINNIGVDSSKMVNLDKLNPSLGLSLYSQTTTGIMFMIISVISVFALMKFWKRLSTEG